MNENVNSQSWRWDLYSGIEDETNPHSNVSVTCPDGATFYCHDIILDENVVLHHALHSDLRESKERRLFIAFDGPSVKAFLRYLYLRAVEEADLKDHGESLLQLGHMYQEQGLFETAGEKLVGQVSDENFDRLLLLADLLGIAELKRTCIEWIWKEPTKLRKAPNYAEIAKTHLMDDILLAKKRGSCLVALGGRSDDRKAVSDVYVWRPGDREWAESPSSMTQGRRGHGAVGIQGMMYVMGGGDGHVDGLSSMEVLDVDSKAWTQLAPMPQISGTCRCAHIDGKIYVAEYEGEIVVVYDISDDEWSVLPYRNPFSIHSFCALGRNLYFANGDGSFRSYNVDTGTVRDCAPMSTLNIHFPEFVTLRNKIYSIGGWVSGSATKLSNVYDPASNTWRDIASLNVARWRHGVSVLDGRIYAVGGYEVVNSRLASMEVYDSFQDRWAFTTSLPKKLNLLAVVDVLLKL